MCNELQFEVTKNSVLNVWLVTKVEEIPYVAPPVVFDEEFSIGQAWVEITYPIEKHFAEYNAFMNGEQDLSKLLFNDFYYPFECDKVDFSGFWHTPHELTFYAKSYLYSTVDAVAEFAVETAGATKIWLNGVLIDEHYVYKRYREARKNVLLPLKQGKNEIIVGCNNLGKRDTQLAFKMRLLSENCFKSKFKVAADAEKADYIAKLLDSACLNRLNYTDGEIELQFAEPSRYDINFTIELSDAEIITDMKNRIVHTVKLLKGETKVSILATAAAWINIISLRVSAAEYELAFTKKYEVEIYPQQYLSTDATGESVEERKKQAMEFLSVHGDNLMQKLLLSVAKGEFTQKEREILVRELRYINDRADCSDFRTPVLLWLLKHYGQAEASPFSALELKNMKGALINYRYWWDEPGNDVMWFFSENHALCFFATALLAGELYPEEIFSNSGMTGIEHTIRAKERLRNWFDNFLARGLDEWNSATYIPIDCIGFFALYELAEDKDVAAWAKEALDKTFAIIAINSFQGVMSASFGRTYMKNLLGRKTAEASSLAWIAWGRGYLNNALFASAMFALSSYRPPKELREIALWQSQEKFIDKRIQGREEAEVYICKTVDYIMGSVNDFKSGGKGVQEHVFEATVKRADTQIWLNHPGETKIFGAGRPSYFAGNGTLPKLRQYKNIMGAFYNLRAEDEVQYTHLYCPLNSFDECERLSEHWLLLRKENVYAAIFAKNGLCITEAGILANKEIVSYGRDNFWLVKVFAEADVRYYKDWKENLPNSVSFAVEGVVYHDWLEGDVRFEGGA